MSPCPCGSGAEYAACCAPFHAGAAEPETPEALMRSRFSAFACGEHDYLWKTLHPDHDDRALDRAAFLASLARGAKGRRYEKLRILGARPPDPEGVAAVLFAATIVERAASGARRDVSFVELSRFAHDGDGWRYLFGTTLPRSACPRDLEGFGVDAFEALALRAAGPPGRRS